MLSSGHDEWTGCAKHSVYIFSHNNLICKAGEDNLGFSTKDDRKSEKCGANFGISFPIQKNVLIRWMVLLMKAFKEQYNHFASSFCLCRSNPDMSPCLWDNGCKENASTFTENIQAISVLLQASPQDLWHLCWPKISLQEQPNCWAKVCQRRPLPIGRGGLLCAEPHNTWEWTQVSSTSLSMLCKPCPVW